MTFSCTLKTKKRLTIFAQSMFFLLGGVEYVVILPTLNEYLGQLNGDATFFGFTMAAFSFSGVLVSPIYGLIRDRYRRTKLLILFANLWEIGGNFLYFYGGSKYILLCSRLISGVGAAVNSAIYADISLTSTESDRSAALAVAAASRQIGLMFGPALNLPLSFCDFYVGPLHVNSFSGPGFLMCILFIILEVITLFCYYEIPPVARQTKMGEESNQVAIGTVKDARADKAISHCDKASKPIQKDAYCKLEHYREDVYHRETKDSSHSKDVKPEKNDSTIAQTSKQDLKIDAFLRDEVVVLLMAQFVIMFTETFLETSLTVMTKRLLDFGGVANSILFAVAGFELLVGYVIVRFVSKFVQDRVVFIFSLTVEIIPFTCLLIFYPNATPGRNNLWWFVTIFVFEMSGAAFLYISILSLFTKVTPVTMQGFAQGVRRAVDGMATILGPLWAGNVQHWPFETLGVIVVLFGILWSLSVLSWQHLRSHSKVMKPGGLTTSDDVNDETKSLIQDTDFSDYGIV